VVDESQGVSRLYTIITRYWRSGPRILSAVDFLQSSQRSSQAGMVRFYKFISIHTTEDFPICITPPTAIV
jgi:hypothetical protein